MGLCRDCRASVEYVHPWGWFDALGAGGKHWCHQGDLEPLVLPYECVCGQLVERPHNGVRVCKHAPMPTPLPDLSASERRSAGATPPTVAPAPNGRPKPKAEALW